MTVRKRKILKNKKKSNIRGGLTDRQTCKERVDRETGYTTISYHGQMQSYIYYLAGKLTSSRKKESK